MRSTCRSNARITTAVMALQSTCLLRNRLIQGFAALLVTSLAPASAQGVDPGPTDSEAGRVPEVSVSASRINRDGYSAPTPVTVMTVEDLQASGQPTVFQAIYDLPVMAGSRGSTNYSTPQSAGTVGLNTFNLRGLGLERTLVLVDGQRITPAWITGVANSAAIPEALIERVDMVTGGASSSWGSDAVAGVVNYVLDNKFTGFKGDVFGGITEYGDDEQGGLSLAAGSDLFSGRGHLIVSGEFYKSDGVPKGIGSRDWYTRTRILQRSIAETPPGEPQLVVAPDVVGFNLAPGGIITGGPLRGIAFGPGGSPYQFNYGSQVAGAFSSGGEQSTDMGYNANISGRLSRAAFYSRFDYELTPATNVFATVMLSSVRTSAHSFPGQYRPTPPGLTIQCDNAFLPQSVADGCASNGVTSFPFGTFTADFPDGVTSQERRMRRFVVGADGELAAFGVPWTWDAYAAYGRTFAHAEVQNTSLHGRFNLAIDAVTTPNGSIVCRSTLTNPGNGCVPFNVIGTGVASQAALDWVLGTPFLDSWIDQHVVSVSANAQPFSLWAGPVSIATGYEYRQESFDQTADAFSEGQGGDPLLNPAGNNWFIGNYHGSHGNYHLNEAFVETAIPLTKGGRIGDTELSLAGRVTDYTTSGVVTTWKAGVTYAPGFASALRFRALRSRDVRAPNLIEGFAAPSSSTVFANDTIPPFANQGFRIQVLTAGNPSLDPEVATTTQFGIVLQPESLPGFSAAVDYWDISIKDVIGSIGLQQVFDLCATGNQTLCSWIDRDALGQPYAVRQTSTNLAKMDASGIDIELTYRTNLADLIPRAAGDLVLRGVATHYREVVADTGIPGAIVTDYAGSSENLPSDVPSWKASFTQSYLYNRLRLSLDQQYVSSGKIRNNYIECTTDCPPPTVHNPTISNNRVSSVFYLGLGGSYDFQSEGESGKAEKQLYFKVDNLLNLDPPINPHLASGTVGYIYRPANHFLHDNLGRTYRLGLRFSF